jgi:hypothetical protein
VVTPAGTEAKSAGSFRQERDSDGPGRCGVTFAAGMSLERGAMTDALARLDRPTAALTGAVPC